MWIGKLQKLLSLTLLVMLTLFTTRTANAYTATELNVYYIDVGHGDAILLQQGDEYALIDTGSSTSWSQLENF